MKYKVELVLSTEVLHEIVVDADSQEIAEEFAKHMIDYASRKMILEKDVYVIHTEEVK